MPVMTAVLLALMIGALIDIILRRDDQVKHLPKVVWVLLVVFLPLIGSILWFTIGREYSQPINLGGFGDPRRREKAAGTFSSTQTMRLKTTEEELADLEREIEFHKQQDRIRQLEAELEERRAKPE
ncbi:PLDc N-terminal domain-containing protein [Agreia sp. VKM Ac-1783]|uniref:PLDc N-terminal domain-containing protein n=1 Tax=Agreia sp. VKM Ac-1783 TaxID=1938889 RepID=UPI000A2AE0F9|nr:PLDc N-terminal domain-containing protein [Agreia sp. VKM Ac-1783]SMQ75061.1 Phospholipase_D-nuclease N-terminal [Agreia sp. VKM Ac-1783]